MGLKALFFQTILNLKVSRDGEINTSPKQKVSIILHSDEKNQGKEENLNHVVRRQDSSKIKLIS